MRYIQKSYRPTWSEINLGNLRYNFKQLKEYIKPVENIMAIVKANAYGHGVKEVSRELLRQGVTYLGVATLDEALMIRRTFKKAPLLILGALRGREVAVALRHNIAMTLSQEETFGEICRIYRRRGKRARVHIIVDTGMGRLGPWHAQADEKIERWARSRALIAEGLYTHFSSAAINKSYTQYQLDSFNSLVKRLGEFGIRFKYLHAANSVTALGYRQAHFNLIRPGIMLYGIYPKPKFKRLINLKPVLMLKTRVMHLKEVPAGRSISYGRTYRTKKRTKIATLPIGYADGYGRILSNKAKVLVSGKRAPVVGMVTMDQTMIDVGHIEGIRLGSIVTLIGKDRGAILTAEGLSRMAGTIPYEILCAISNRVPRAYLP